MHIKFIFCLLLGMLVTFHTQGQSPRIDKITAEGKHMVIYGTDLDKTEVLEVNNKKIEHFNPSKTALKVHWKELPDPIAGYYQITLIDKNGNDDKKRYKSDRALSDNNTPAAETINKVPQRPDYRAISAEELSFKTPENLNYQVDIKMPELTEEGESLDKYRHRLLQSIKNLKQCGFENLQLEVIANINKKQLEKETFDLPYKIEGLERDINYDFEVINEDKNFKGAFSNKKGLFNQWDRELFRIACLQQAIFDDESIDPADVIFLLNTDKRADQGISFKINVELPKSEIIKAQKNADFYAQLKEELNKFGYRNTYNTIQDVKYDYQKNKSKLVFSYVNYEPYSKNSIARADITTFTNKLSQVINYLKSSKKLESIQLEFESFDTGSWNNESPLSSNYEGEFENRKELTYFMDGEKGSTSVSTGKPLSIMQEELLKLQYLKQLLNLGNDTAFHLMNNEEAYQKLTRVVITIKS